MNIRQVWKRYFRHIIVQNRTVANLFLKIMTKVLSGAPISSSSSEMYPVALNNEGKDEYGISWRFANKKHGITGIGRLHNSADFLKIVVESRLDVFDEIILIDNNSTDETYAICLDLQKAYPEKIIVKQYPFAIAKPYSDEHRSTAADSLHSLVYYYNRCFSQASYNIVCKVDDDNLLIPELYTPARMRQEILQMPSGTYYTFSGYNITQIDGVYKLLPLADRYSGVIGDIGFYYQDENRYFYKDHNYEKLNKNDLSYTWFGFVYLHLKYLKSGASLPGGGVGLVTDISLDRLAKKYIRLVGK